MKQKANPFLGNSFLNHALVTAVGVFSASSLHADTASLTFAPTADTRIIDSWGANTNYGNDGEMGIYNSRDRSLLQFIMVPVGATVTSANLSVTVTGTYGGNPVPQSMDVYRLTGSWAETGVTWNTQPAYDGAIQASSTANPEIGQTITWNVTSLANEWASGSVANNGLIIINNGTNNGLHFATKENSNVSYRPTLTTAFTTPTSAPSAGWSWSGGTGTWSDTDKWLNGVTPATWTDNTDAVFGNGSDAAGTVTISGTVTPRTLWFQNTGSGNYTISGGTIDFGGAMRIVDTAIDTTISSTLTNGALFKQGSGKLTLAGSLGYKGGTVVSSGTLALPEGDWHTGNPWDGNGATGAITVGSGATLSTSQGVTEIKNGLTLNGGTVSSRGNYYGTGNGTWGNLVLSSNISAGNSATSTISSEIRLSGNRSVDVGSDSTLNITGGVAIWPNGGTNFGITKTGTGTLALSAANGYNGVTDITAGTLVAASSTALGTGAWNGSTMTWVRDGATLALQGNVSLDEHMHMTGAGVGGLGALRSLSGDNALTLYNGGGSSGPGFALDGNTTVGVDADTLTVTGFYHDSGSYGITKVGNGTLTLSSTSTYTGDTTVSAGTLLVNGELGTSAVTVGPNGTIGGSGLILGSLNFDANAKLTVNLADVLSVNGIVSFDGFGFDDLVNFNVQTVAEGTYTLLSGSSFDFANVEHYGFSNALTRTDGKLAYFQSGSLQVVVVPEPEAALLGGLGLLALLRRRR